MTFDVAFVCTGNRYRSVLAAATFEAATEALPVRVRSFGTLDVGGAGPLPEAVEAAQGFGLDISGHSARCVLGADLSDASLVLGFEGVHAHAAVAAGARPERTFTLSELLELVERVGDVPESEPVARAVELIERAHELRRAGGRAAEIRDPIGLKRPRQDAIGGEVHTATTRAAELLFGKVGAGAPRATTGAG